MCHPVLQSQQVAWRGDGDDPPQPRGQGVLPPLVFPKWKGMEPGAALSSGPQMEGGWRHRATCCCRLKGVSNESHQPPYSSNGRNLEKCIFAFKDTGSSSLFFEVLQDTGIRSAQFGLSQISDASGKQTC